MGPETTPRAGDKGRFTIQKSKLLLGEGRDEEEFFKAFLNHLELSESVQVHQYKGRDQLQAFIKALAKDPDFQLLEMLAVTRDADTQGVRGAFDSISGFLNGTGLSAPKEIGEFSEGTPSVGVFLLPNGRDAGMLEDSCLESITTDFRMGCVDRFFDCLAGLETPSPANRSKARLRCFLSAQEEDIGSLGLAAQKRVWNFDHESFRPIKEFLLQLR